MRLVNFNQEIRSDHAITRITWSLLYHIRCLPSVDLYHPVAVQDFWEGPLSDKDSAVAQCSIAHCGLRYNAAQLLNLSH